MKIISFTVLGFNECVDSGVSPVFDLSKFTSIIDTKLSKDMYYECIFLDDRLVFETLVFSLPNYVSKGVDEIYESWNSAFFPDKVLDILVSIGDRFAVALRIKMSAKAPMTFFKNDMKYTADILSYCIVNVADVSPKSEPKIVKMVPPEQYIIANFCENQSVYTMVKPDEKPFDVGSYYRHNFV